MIWIFFCVNTIDRYIYWWDRICGNLWIDRYFRILSSTRTWRLRYTFLKYPVGGFTSKSKVSKWSYSSLFFKELIFLFYYTKTDKPVQLRLRIGEKLRKKTFACFVLWWAISINRKRLWIIFAKYSKI